jgi:hypothetical protein
MQRTRLDTLVNTLTSRFLSFFSNPWRTIALMIIGILFGFFMGITIISTAGQAALWDVPVSASLLVITEAISRWVYGQNQRSLGYNLLNVFKIGLTYSLFLQAFILGS